MATNGGDVTIATMNGLGTHGLWILDSGFWTLDWTGLDWIGLDWTGLDWTRLD